MERIFDELFESKRDLFDKVMNLTYDGAHNFLFMNVPSQRLFKNLKDEIIIDFK